MVSQGGDLATIPNMKINDHLSSIAKVSFQKIGFRDFLVHFFHEPVFSLSLNVMPSSF
jgi:hypothetical protein